jgi:hypothetical protein
MKIRRKELFSKMKQFLDKGAFAGMGRTCKEKK